MISRLHFYCFWMILFSILPLRWSFQRHRKLTVPSSEYLLHFYPRKLCESAFLSVYYMTSATLLHYVRNTLNIKTKNYAKLLREKNKLKELVGKACWQQKSTMKKNISVFELEKYINNSERINFKTTLPFLPRKSFI